MYTIPSFQYTKYSGLFVNSIRETERTMKTKHVYSMVGLLSLWHFPHIHSRFYWQMNHDKWVLSDKYLHLPIISYTWHIEVLAIVHKSGLDLKNIVLTIEPWKLGHDKTPDKNHCHRIIIAKSRFLQREKNWKTKKNNKKTLLT